MTQCHQIDAFLDRRMSPDEAAEFESHAARCADCGSTIEQWREIENEVSKIADAKWSYEPTPMAAQRLVRRATTSTHERVRPAWGLRLGVGFAAAAAVVLVVVGVQWVSPSPVQSTVLKLALVDGESAAPLYQVANAGTLLASSGQRRVLVELGDDRIGVSRSGKVEVVEAVAGHTRLKLIAGSVGLRVAKRKAGERVEVEAAGTLVTVVGTQFMVSLRPAGGVDVNVAEGRVRVEVQGHAPVEISAEEAIHITNAGRLRLTSMSTHAGRSLGRLLRDPNELPAMATRPPVERETKSLRAPAKALQRRPARAKIEADLDLWRDWVLAGRYDAAERSLVGYLKSAQRDVEAWSLLADCRRKKNDWTGAVKAYREIIALGESAATNRARLKAASILQDELDNHGATVPLLRAYIAKGVPIRSLQAAARLRLARSLEALGKGDAARKQLQTVTDDYADTSAGREAGKLLLRE